VAATSPNRGIEASRSNGLARCILIGVSAGWAIALLLTLPTELSRSLANVRFVMWPSSVWLLVTAGVEHSGQAYVVLAVSIAANGLLYGAMGASAWLVLKFLRAASGSAG
jgi:hypothetical protein